MFLGKLLNGRQPGEDEEWKVPVITGNELLPDPDYKLQSSKEELARRIALEPFMGGINAGRHMADVVLKTFSPQLYQNLDEWVMGREITPIAYGPHRITFEFYIREWNRHCIGEERKICMGYSVLTKMNYYIRSGNLGSIYDFWYDIILPSVLFVSGDWDSL